MEGQSVRKVWPCLLSATKYEGDFDARRLSTQLNLLYEVFRSKGEISSLADVVDGLKQLGDARYIYSEVNAVLQQSSDSSCQQCYR